MIVAATFLFLAQADQPLNNSSCGKSKSEAGAAICDALASVRPDSEPEIDCGDAQSQMEMNVCSFRDFEAADAALNREWKLASDRAKESDRFSAARNLAGGNFDRLFAAQRKWLEFRDAQCLSEVGPREGGGSIWPLRQNACLRQLTEARSAQLRQFNEPSN